MTASVFFHPVQGFKTQEVMSFSLTEMQTQQPKEITRAEPSVSDAFKQAASNIFEGGNPLTPSSKCAL